MKRVATLAVTVAFASIIILPTIKQANAFFIQDEKTNTCADWLSNTNNENQARYRWVLGFVHGTETTRYPGRVDYLASKDEVSKQAFIEAIDKVCKNNPRYPLSGGVANLIMDSLNLTPQSKLPQEPYMLEISVCDGKVEAFVGTGELVRKGVKMIYLDECNLFAAERNSSIGRQILKECPLHSRCHVEGHVPGESGIEVLVTVERIK